MKFSILFGLLTLTSGFAQAAAVDVYDSINGPALNVSYTGPSGTAVPGVIVEKLGTSSLMPSFKMLCQKLITASGAHSYSCAQARYWRDDAQKMYERIPNEELKIVFRSESGQVLARDVRQKQDARFLCRKELANGQTSHTCYALTN